MKASIEKSLKDELKSVRGLKSIAIFGSFLWKKRKAGDIDVLLVTERKLKQSMIKRLEERLHEKIGKVVEIHNLSEEEFMLNAEEGNPLLLAIFKDYKIIHDPENLIWKVKNLYVTLHKKSNLQLIYKGKKIRVCDLEWP